MTRYLTYPEIPFHALLSRAAERWPEKTAIVFRDQETTFAELDDRATRVARGLLDLGVRKGDRVGLYTPNCPEYEVAFFACTRVGAVPTPLNPSYREREVLAQLMDSHARALILHPSLMPVVESIRDRLPDLTEVVVLGGAAIAGTRPLEELARAPADLTYAPHIDTPDLAALPYSSGTTGLSKGVMLTQRNLVCNALQFVEATQTTDRDVLMIFLPLYHIYGVALIATAVAGGASQVLMERFDLQEMLRLVETYQITELYVVPPVMLALASAPDLRSEQFGSVRFVMSAAAPLAADVARRVADRLNLRVIQAYGMTESSPLTHMVPVDDWSEVLGTVGVVAADTQCRIVDIESGTRNLGPGEVGEVAVFGPQVMAGYWNAPEESAATIRDGWLYTGDIGSVDETGNLSIVDRKKEMIKYKAFSIAPAELEAVLLEHPDVVDCGVTGQPDVEAGEVPRAAVVLRSDSTATPEELQAFVAARVAAYKQIRVLELVDTIPRTPSGKILRRVLKEQTRATAV